MWPKKIFRKFQIDFFFYENVFLFPIFFWPTEWKKLILWSWRILEQFIQIVKVQRNSFWKKNGIQTPTGKVRKLFIFTRGLPGAISSFLVLLIHTASRMNCNLLEKNKINRNCSLLHRVWDHYYPIGPAINYNISREEGSKIDNFT